MYIIYKEKMLEKLSFIMDGVKSVLDTLADYVLRPPWYREFMEGMVIDAPCKCRKKKELDRRKYESVRSFHEYRQSLEKE